MSSLQGKPLQAITEQDLQQLITQSEQESQTLEYKREPYKHNDEETREMLRDISSIANAYGGDLLIGVDENVNGAAITLMGIEKAEDESQRIIGSCLSNIAERIGGLQIYPVPLQNGRFVLVVRIPHSLRAPHMVTFKGLNQFWIRHDRQKSPMSIHEIKDTCLKVEGLMEKLERFLAKRRQDILEEIGDVPYYVVSVTPLFVNAESIDIRDITLRNLLDTLPPFGGNSLLTLWSAPAQPTLYGLKIQPIKRGPQPWSIELFRNGYLEFRLKADREPVLKRPVVQTSDMRNALFDPSALSGYTLAFLHLASAILTHCGLTDPLVVSLSFYNIKDFGIYPGSPFPHPSEIQPWAKTHLEIPPLQFFSLPFTDTDNTKKTAKECLDRLWQAFGYEGAPNLPW